MSAAGPQPRRAGRASLAGWVLSSLCAFMQRICMSSLSPERRCPWTLRRAPALAQPGVPAARPPYRCPGREEVFTEATCGCHRSAGVSLALPAVGVGLFQMQGVILASGLPLSVTLLKLLLPLLSRVR